MAEDVVPALWAQIEDTFKNKVKVDPLIKSIARKTEAETATLRDVYTYASELSQTAVNTLIICLSADNLPDGKLYWNIAERTIVPLYRIVHEMIIDLAVEVTKAEDKKQSIGLKPIRTKFNEERIRTIINVIVNESSEDDEIYG